MAGVEKALSQLKENQKKIKKIASITGKLSNKAKETADLCAELAAAVTKKTKWRHFVDDIAYYRKETYITEKDIEKMRISMRIKTKPKLEHTRRMMEIPLNQTREKAMLWLESVNQAIEYQKKKNSPKEKINEERFDFCNQELEAIHKILEDLEAYFTTLNNLTEDITTLLNFIKSPSKEEAEHGTAQEEDSPPSSPSLLKRIRSRKRSKKELKEFEVEEEGDDESIDEHSQTDEQEQQTEKVQEVSEEAPELQGSVSETGTSKVEAVQSVNSDRHHNDDVPHEPNENDPLLRYSQSSHDNDNCCVII